MRDDGKKALIETRGEGGYAIAPSSPVECHPDRLPDTHVAGPPLQDLQTITPEEHELLWTVARSFNRYVKDESVVTDPRPYEASQGLRPGDDFNQRGDWEILLGAGVSHGTLPRRSDTRPPAR